MVGTYATADLPQSDLRQRAFAGVFAAARWFAWVIVVTVVGILTDSARLNAESGEADPGIGVSGNVVYRWQIGDADASLLTGNCVLLHGDTTLVADQILMVTDGETDNVRSRVVVASTNWGQPRAFTFHTQAEPKIAAPVLRGAPDQRPALLDLLPTESATNTSDSLVQQVQFTPSPGAPLIDAPTRGVVIDQPPPIVSSQPTLLDFVTADGNRSVEILARNPSMPPQIQSINRPETNESVIILRGGATVMVRDLQAQFPGGDMMQLGTVTLSADRIVAWTPLLSDLFSGTINMSQSNRELYLEGDIVFRQGERIIYAESMYYDVNTQRGMILDAEAITTVPNYQGIVRLKAEVLQQVAQGNFIAFDAAVTTSRMGVPRYWLQSERLQLTDRQGIGTDPVTGTPVVDSEPFVNSRDNFVYVGGVPIFYWPAFSTSLDRPAYYVTGIETNSDNIFGTQILVDFDLLQLFGIENAPPGIDWGLSTDYLSDRGPAIGTTLRYSLPGLFGTPGPVNGFFDAWFIYDSGLDTLGRDRVNLVPATKRRGRTLLQHRHYLPNDFELIAEFGWVSDINFLEQYLEEEWDRNVDHRTALRLRKYYFNQLFDLSAKARVNDFVTETERLPQLDHYLLGGSLLGDRLTWSMHNRATYAKLRVGDLPTDPAEAVLFSPTPGEVNAQGVIASTRQEIALPVQLGPVRVVPNVSGEASHYGEASNGEQLTRLIGQAGVRASLPMWRVDPTVQSSLLNVRGLAHKVEWTAEYFYADSDAALDDLPLYDQLDDNAQQQFRRRFITEQFGGVLPARFDPRTFAFRQGFQRYIASPSDVIADDLQQFRAGLHQRWQTKRGLPGRERIVDLFEADLDVILFPDADRDNFGETLGPATYDVRYHIGDRVTLLSDGYVDFFDDGLRSISGGVRSSRPGVGDIYVGLLSLQGPIDSTVVRTAMDYRLNEKWIASAGTTYDFGVTGNVGQSLAVTRIGESVLLRLGVNVDRGRDNVGVGFTIEPRFWPKPRLGRIGGALIPPPGVEGLE